jgi:hypothetical protein
VSGDLKTRSVVVVGAPGQALVGYACHEDDLLVVGAGGSAAGGVGGGGR